MNTKRRTGRLLGVLLCLVLVLGQLPTTALAEGNDLKVTGATVTINGVTTDVTPAGDNPPCITAPVFSPEDTVSIRLKTNRSSGVTWKDSPHAPLSDFGMTLDKSTGVVSRIEDSTATVTGYSTIIATDSAGNSVQFFLYIYCISADNRAKITTESLKNGTVGESYADSISFSGYCNGWQEWEITSGNLPDGLELVKGTVKGTPTTAGTFNFTVQLKIMGGTATEDLSIIINPAVTAPEFKSDRSLPHAVRERSYSYDLNNLLKETDSNITWSGSDLPKGLSLDAATGVLSGTFAGEADKTTWSYFRVMATRTVNGVKKSAQEWVSIACYDSPQISISEADSTLTMTAGTYAVWQPGYTGSTAQWSYKGALPAGLSFNTADGSLYGTPIEPGTYQLTLEAAVIDSESSTPFTDLTTTKNITVTVADSGGISLSLTEYTFPGQKLDYTSGGSVTVTVLNTGYTDLNLKVSSSSTNFTVSPGTLTLPARTGSEMPSAEFTVTPQTDLTKGTHSATITVADSHNGKTAQLTVNFDVTAEAVAPKITTGSNLGYAIAGRTNTFPLQFTSTGTTTWSVSDYSDNEKCPEWVTISDGVLSITPPKNCDEIGEQLHFYVKMDDESPYQEQKERFYVNIYWPVVKLSYSKDVDTEIQPDAARDGYVGTDYTKGYDGCSNDLYATVRGCDSYIFALEGNVPPGLTIQRADDRSTYGTIAGKPTRAGTYTFDLVVKGYADDNKEQYIGETRKTFTITVYDALAFNDTVQKISDLATGTLYVGQAVNEDLAQYVSGGKAPYTFAAAANLPAGLSLSEDGKLTGAPTVPGDKLGYNWIEVTDANGMELSQPVTIGDIQLPAPAVSEPDGVSFLSQTGITVKLAQGYPVGDKNIKLYYTTDGSSPAATNGEEFTAGQEITVGKGNAAGTTVTLKMIAEYTADSGTTRWSGVTTVTYTSMASPAAPTASRESGTFTSPFPLTLSCSTVGASVYYTTDGKDPATNGTLWDGTPIIITGTTTVRAKACYVTGVKTLKYHYGEEASFTYTEVEGVAVSGTVTSYNPGSATTVQLMQGGTQKYEATIAATTGSGQATQTFSIPTVAAGTYDLVVSKPGHLTYTVKNVVVESADLNLADMAGEAYQTITLLAGDVNGDGSITEDDVSVIRYSTNINKATTSAADTLADVNGDGSVTEDDVSIVRYATHINKGTENCTYQFKEG